MAFDTRRFGAAVALAGMSAVSAPALANPGGIFKATLVGYEEVPAVSSPGSGIFEARALPHSQAIEFTLDYSGLQGTPFMAHIHVGQHSVNGGIAIWLCGNAGAPNLPAGTQPCPPSGTVSGTLTASNVVGPGAQLVSAGELDEVLAAMKAGVAYVNVHTNLVPGGEIRGQVR